MSEPSTLEETESGISFEEINTVTNIDTTNDHEMEDEDETQWDDPNNPNSVNEDENMVEDNLEVDQIEESHGNLNNEGEEEVEPENDNENLPTAEEEELDHMNQEEEEIEEEEDIEQVQNDEHDNEDENEAPEKLSQLPISKIRRIMKIGLSDDSGGIKIVSKESAFLVGQATELFIAALAQQTAKITQHSKKKTMTMQHLAASIADSEEFAFLESTMVPDYDF